MSDSTLTYIPQFLFVCDEMQAPGEKADCWLFFLSFIIPSPLTQGLQAGAWSSLSGLVRSFLFLFPNVLFVFSRLWLNYSLPTLWSWKYHWSSIQSLLNLEKAEEGASFSASLWGWLVLLTTPLLTMGTGQVASPTKSAPSGLVRTKRAVTSAARSQFFCALLGRKACAWCTTQDIIISLF